MRMQEHPAWFSLLPYKGCLLCSDSFPLSGNNKNHTARTGHFLFLMSAIIYSCPGNLPLTARFPHYKHFSAGLLILTYHLKNAGEASKGCQSQSALPSSNPLFAALPTAEKVLPAH